MVFVAVNSESPLLDSSLGTSNEAKKLQRHDNKLCKPKYIVLDGTQTISDIPDNLSPMTR